MHLVARLSIPPKLEPLVPRPFVGALTDVQTLLRSKWLRDELAKVYPRVIKIRCAPA